jgi:hypothetical protein
MTRDEFWEHIRATRRDDPDAHVDRLVKRLAKLPPEEILDFEHWWGVAEAEAYFWDLWGAAYLINGGCSDDGFTDFRSWLILQGREVFEAAVRHPDSLSDVLDGGDEASCECYPASRAWFEATGTERDEAGYDAYHAACVTHEKKKPKAKRRGMGRRWDFENDAQVRKRLPRLAAMYLGRPDE